MITSNTTIIILFLIVLIPLIFIKNSKFNESFTQKIAGQKGATGNDSDCAGTRSNGKMRDGRCYFEYTDQNSCNGIKWKKCDASRGDHKGDPDSGRYVINGNKRIFCRLDESKGSDTEGECVSDWEENIENPSPNTMSNNQNTCQERPDGLIRKNTCYYKYTDQNVCTGIKWKKCDATRGDKTGQPDSGRYVINGNKRIFCRLDESKGSDTEGECVTDFEEILDSAPAPAPAPTPAPATTPLIPPTKAPIQLQCPDTCGIHGDMDALREQISFVQNSLISV
tara:strand:+ start:2621 stop:3463 length:843 start_codon:yes stop_codon:yes gene_type:complete